MEMIGNPDRSYLNTGENRQAVKVLDALLEKHPNNRDAQMLKREIAGSKTRP